MDNNSFRDHNIYGIYFWATGVDSVFTYNNITGNANYGIRVSSSSFGNTFYGNWINNTLQAYDQTSTNIWNASYPLGGNYWRDPGGAAIDQFSGANQDQAGSDGISDTNFGITGALRIDEYPRKIDDFDIDTHWDAHDD